MKRPEHSWNGGPSAPSPGPADDKRGLSAELYARARPIFCDALDRSPGERRAFVREACAGDDVLLSVVESLLLNDEAAPDFMEAPAMASVGIADSLPSASLRVGQHLGPYEITAFIGAGGMSEVYCALDPRLGRQVAIKVLPQAFTADRERLARLEREARVLAALNHPHIATIHGLEESDGIRALVLELVEGESLEKWITPEANESPGVPGRAPQGAGTRVSLAEALTIARQVADALSAAHRKNVVHRDLKPANIIVYRAHDSAGNTSPASDVRVKVIDFGIAKSLSGVVSTQAMTAAATADGTMLGTAPYMSPEQARGKPVDQRTDIWAFGCVLYEMLTGRRAFPGETVSDTVAAILEREPDWQRLPADTPPGIRGLLLRCLEKDSTRRLAHIGDAIGQLDEALVASARAGNASRDLPATEPRLWAWRGRRVVLATLLAVVAVAVTTGTMLLMGTGGGPAIRSLAVLPFKPLGDDQKENYIGLSVADSIIMRISQADAVVVRPTSAVRQYAAEDADALDAGETLGVDAVLDGTWQRQDNRFRISVNLLSVSDGSSLWTERFDMRADDIFVLQDQVSDQLASRLRLQLEPPRQVQGGRSGTRSMDAYDAYAKGQFYFGERRANGPHTNLDNAISLFERAVSVDKDFAEAHAYLGYAYAWSAAFKEDNPALIERAKTELNTAERLQLNLGIVHVARGFILWTKYGGWRIGEALKEQRLAARLDPGLADLELGALYNHLGFLDEWRTNAEHALNRDPTNQSVKLTYVNEHFQANLPEEGWAAQKRLLNTGPDQRYFLLTRRASDAAPLVEKAASQSPDDGGALKNLALLRALQGRHAEAQALVPEVLRLTPKNRTYHHVTYDIARVYAVAGDGEQAARWLDETIRWGMPNYPMFAGDRFLDRVRESPRVVAIMTGLKSQWDRYREELR